MQPDQDHEGHGDNVGNNKIGSQTNLGDGSTYNVYHVYPGGKQIDHHLTPVPFRPDGFVGREVELETIKQHLEIGDRFLLLMSGEGGIGKTTLAAKYYFNRQTDYQHQAWLLSEKSITLALLRLEVPLGIVINPTDSLAQRLRQLIDAMNNLKGPSLLVIDNANEMDLEEYKALRRLTHFHVLLTTRLPEFEQAECFRLQGLPWRVALGLFKKHFPQHDPSEDGLFETLHQAVWGNTLVLELMAKNLRAVNKGRLRPRYRLSHLLADLAKKDLLQLSQTAAFVTDYHATDATKARTINEVVEAMYDLDPLSEAERALLSVLSVLPAERILLERLEALIPSEDLEPCLVALADKGWLDLDRVALSFMVGPVVQAVTRAIQRERLFGDSKGLVKALNEKLLYHPATGHFLNVTYPEAKEYARMGEAIVPCFADPEDAIAVLCERLGNYYKTFGDLPQALEYYQNCNRLERELHSAFPDDVEYKNSFAVSFSKLGNIYSAFGDLQRALANYCELNILKKELYEAFQDNVDFKHGLAISFSKLGHIYTALNDLPEALNHFEKYNQLEKELHAAFPENVEFKHGLAISFQNMGNLHTALGDLTQALKYCEEYNRLEKEFSIIFPENEDFKHGLAVSFSLLGNVQTALGDLPNAWRQHELFNHLERELHLAFPDNVEFKHGLAVSYWKLGDLARKQNDPHIAKSHFQQAEQLWAALVEAAPAFVMFRNNLEAAREALASLEA
jgi:tetratricopeptide (TPR) repeat protein